MEYVEHFHVGRFFKSPKDFCKVVYDKTPPAGPHDHNFYELVIVVKGKGIHVIGNSKISLSRGDVFVIPPMIIHSFLNCENLEIINILVKTEFIQKRQHKSQKVPGYLKLMEIEPFVRQSYDKSMFLHLNQLQFTTLQQDLAFIEPSNPLFQINNYELQYHTIWKIIYYLSYLLYEHLGKTTGTDSKRKYETQILDTLEYIHQNFSNKISVNDLATRAFLSRSTFLRNFQTVCGCSPMQYLNQYRIKKAKELLDMSTMSKTEIAHSCGFYDLSHMERCIKSNNIENAGR